MNDQQLQKDLNDAKNCYMQAAKLLKAGKTQVHVEAAIMDLTKAATQGLVEAQYQLGMIYTIGEHVQRNLTLAFHWFSQASLSNFIPAQFTLATLHSKNKDFTQAFEILSALANQGVTEAETNLANLYLEARGVNKDARKAVKLLINAANKGDRLAQYRLGQLYYQGKEIPTDYVNARKYVVMAMEQRYLPAYLIMGSMLEHGFGIDKNVVKAYTFYSYCLSYGMKNLGDLMSDVIETLDEPVKQQAKQLAMEFCKNEPAPI